MASSHSMATSHCRATVHLPDPLWFTVKWVYPLCWFRFTYAPQQSLTMMDPERIRRTMMGRRVASSLLLKKASPADADAVDTSRTGLYLHHRPAGEAVPVGREDLLSVERQQSDSEERTPMLSRSSMQRDWMEEGIVVLTIWIELQSPLLLNTGRPRSMPSIELVGRGK